jgi:hypothetical protein
MSGVDGSLASQTPNSPLLGGVGGGVVCEDDEPIVVRKSTFALKWSHGGGKTPRRMLDESRTLVRLVL